MADSEGSHRTKRKFFQGCVECSYLTFTGSAAASPGSPRTSARSIVSIGWIWIGRLHFSVQRTWIKPPKPERTACCVDSHDVNGNARHYGALAWNIRPGKHPNQVFSEFNQVSHSGLLPKSEQEQSTYHHRTPNLCWSGFLWDPFFLVAESSLACFCCHPLFSCPSCLRLSCPPHHWPDPPWRYMNYDSLFIPWPTHWQECGNALFFSLSFFISLDLSVKQHAFAQYLIVTSFPASSSIFRNFFRMGTCKCTRQEVDKNIISFCCIFFCNRRRRQIHPSDAPFYELPNFTGRWWPNQATINSWNNRNRQTCWSLSRVILDQMMPEGFLRCSHSITFVGVTM